MDPKLLARLAKMGIARADAERMDGPAAAMMADAYDKLHGEHEALKTEHATMKAAHDDMKTQMDAMAGETPETESEGRQDAAGKKPRTLRQIVDAMVAERAPLLALAAAYKVDAAELVKPNRELRQIVTLKVDPKTPKGRSDDYYRAILDRTDAPTTVYPKVEIKPIVRADGSAPAASLADHIAR